MSGGAPPSGNEEAHQATTISPTSTDLESLWSQIPDPSLQPQSLEHTAEVHILDAGRSDRRSTVLNGTTMASTQGGHALEPHPKLHGCTTITRSSRGQMSNSRLSHEGSGTLRED
uniref:Uncharacterized protein n=1 Tax=Oryza nivara TaxID=4536 RepID=A0A0E0IAM0_ORYNI